MTPKHKRPPRTKKPDRLTNPDANRAETLMHFALGPFDTACRAADLKWGVDRLPDIVSPQSALIWGQTMANLNEATRAAHDGDTEQRRADIIACVESALRGFAAMDAEAEANGASKANTRVWEHECDGYKFAVMADDAAWPAIKAERPDLVLHSMREVGIALKAMQRAIPALDEIKKTFPNASIKRIKTDFTEKNGGDPINFGSDVIEEFPF
mgnify:CR=1 FL=1